MSIVQIGHFWMASLSLDPAICLAFIEWIRALDARVAGEEWTSQLVPGATAQAEATIAMLAALVYAILRVPAAVGQFIPSLRPIHSEAIGVEVRSDLY